MARKVVGLMRIAQSGTTFHGGVIEPEADFVNARWIVVLQIADVAGENVDVARKGCPLQRGRIAAVGTGRN